MSRTVLRRALAGLAATAAVALLAPLPAQAAPAAKVTVRVDDLHVVRGDTESGRVKITLISDRAVTIGAGSIDLALSGGLTDVVLSGNLRMFPCEDTSGPTLSCQLLVQELPAGSRSAGHAGFVHAGENSVLGETGVLTVTISAEKLKPVTGTGKVTVGPAPSTPASPSPSPSPSPSVSVSVSASVSPSASGSASPSAPASPSVPAGASPSASVSASVSPTPASGGEGGGEGGGGLPVTGPQGASLAVVGAGLVLAGVGGFLLARRNRARFEA